MRQRILSFPTFSMQLKHDNNSFPSINEPLLNPHEMVLQPGKLTMLSVKYQIYKKQKVTGVLQPSQNIETTDELTICASIICSKNHHYINNIQYQPYTLKRSTHIANFSILTPEQLKYIQPIEPAPIRHLLDNNSEEAIQYVNSLLKTPGRISASRPIVSPHCTVQATQATAHRYKSVSSRNYMHWRN